MFRLTFDRAPIGMTMLAVDGSGRVLRSNAALPPDARPRRRHRRDRPADHRHAGPGRRTWPADSARSLAFVAGERGEDAHGEDVRPRGRDDLRRPHQLLGGPRRRRAGRCTCSATSWTSASAPPTPASSSGWPSPTASPGCPTARRMEDRLADALARLAGRPAWSGSCCSTSTTSRSSTTASATAPATPCSWTSPPGCARRCPPGTTVARLGGDEFVAVVADVAQRRPRSHAGRPTACSPRCAARSTWPAPAWSPPRASAWRSATPPAARRSCCATPTSRCTGPRRRAGTARSPSTPSCGPAPTSGWPPRPCCARALEHGWLRLHLQPVVGLDRRATWSAPRRWSGSSTPSAACCCRGRSWTWPRRPAWSPRWTPGCSRRPSPGSPRAPAPGSRSTSPRAPWRPAGWPTRVGEVLAAARRRRRAGSASS